VAYPVRCVSPPLVGNIPVMRLSRLGVALVPAAAAFFIWPTPASRQGVLSVQVTPADTAAILRAAVGSGWHLSGVLEFRVVDGGDAAVLVSEQTPPHPLADSVLVPRFGYARDFVRVVRRRRRRWVRQ